MEVLPKYPGCQSWCIGVKATRKFILTLAAVVSAVASVGAWLLPGGRSTVEAPSPPVSNPIELVQSEERQEGAGSKVAQDQPVAEPASSADGIRKGENREDLTFQEFDLADGEQRVLCSGRAGISAEFSKVAGVELVSLRVNELDTSTVHAILGSGARVKLRCDETEHYVSILNIDNSSRVIQLRLD